MLIRPWAVWSICDRPPAPHMTEGPDDEDTTATARGGLPDLASILDDDKELQSYLQRMVGYALASSR